MELVGVVSLIVAACGGGGPTATPIHTPASGATSVPATATLGPALSGTVQIDGSSTVFPVTEAVVEEFRGRGPARPRHGGCLRERRRAQALLRGGDRHLRRLSAQLTLR